MCKIRFTNPILNKFAKTISPDGLIDDLMVFVVDFNNSNLIYKLENLELKLRLHISDDNILTAIDPFDNIITEYNGEFVTPTKLPPVKETPVKDVDEYNNDLIAWESGIKTSTNSSKVVNGVDIIKNDLKTKTREFIFDNLDDSYVLVNIPDSPNFYPDKFKPKEYHTITVVVKKDQITDNMTLDEILELVPSWAKWENKPFPISLEYEHNIANHGNTAHGKRDHAQRTLIRSENEKISIEEASDAFINEFNVVQSTKRVVKESPRYAIYEIKSISDGIGGSINGDKNPIPSKYFNHAVLEEGITVRATGEVILTATETIDSETRAAEIQMLPVDFSEDQLNFIFTNFVKDGKFNSDIIPLLQLLLGNKPNRDEFSILHKDGVFSVSFVLEDGNKFVISEGEAVSQETIDNLKSRFNTVIRKNYSMTLGLKYQHSNVSIREALDYLHRDVEFSNKLVTSYLKLMGLNLNSTLQEYLITEFTPKYNPNTIETSTGRQPTYYPVNKYAYLSNPKIQDLGFPKSDITELVHDKFEESGIEIIRYPSFDDLNKAYYEEHGEYLPNNANANWFTYRNVDGVVTKSVHLDSRDRRDYVETEEKIHALVFENLQTELEAEVSSKELKQLRKVALAIKGKIKTSKNKALWEDIFKGDETRQLNELLARGTTYPELIADLKEWEVKDKSLFDLFIGAIQNLVNKVLGLDNSNYYELLINHTVSLMEREGSVDIENSDVGSFFSYMKVPDNLTTFEIRSSLDYLFSLYIASDATPLSFSRLGESYSLATKLKFKSWLEASGKFNFDIDIEEWFNDEDSQFTFSEDDTTNEELENLEEKEQSIAYDKDRGTAIRIQDRLTDRLRQLFRILPQTDYNNNLVRNENTGVPRLSPLNETIQDLYINLSGIVSPDIIISKLRTLGNTDPKFKLLYIALDLKNNPYSDLARSFYSMLQNTELKVLKAVINTIEVENKVKTTENVYTESGENLPLIIGKWNSNFKEILNGDDFKNGLMTKVLKAEVQGFYEKPSLEKGLTIFKKFGITLSPKTLREVENNPVLRKQLTKQALALQGSNTHEYRFKDFRGKDNISSANDLFRHTSFYKEIIKLESTYSPFRKSIMTRNAKGDLVNVYTLPNTALLQRNILNQLRDKLNDEVSDDELTLAVQGMLKNITDVKFPKSLRDKLISGEVKIEIFNLEGFKESENESTSDLANHGYIKQQALFWKNQQTFEFQRTETGSSAWGYKLVKGNGAYTEPYIYNKLSRKDAIDKALPHFKELFEGEIAKLRLLSKDTNNPFGKIGTTPTRKYNNLLKTMDVLVKQRSPLIEIHKSITDPAEIQASAKVIQALTNRIKVLETDLSQNHIAGDYDPFQIFGFLPINTRASLITNQDADIEVLWTGVERLVKRELNQTIDLGIDGLNEYSGVLGEKMTPSSFLLNYKLHQSYSTLLHYGDGNWFGKFFKRAKGVVSTGTGNPTSVELYKTITPDIANVFTDSENQHEGSIKVKVSTLKDLNDKYENIEEDNEVQKSYPKFAKNVETSIDKFLSKQKMSDNEKLLIKSNLLKGLEAYRKEINTADGQSWGTLDLFKTMLKGLDLWETQGLDALYAYELEYMKVLKELGLDGIRLIENVSPEFLSESDITELTRLKELRQLMIEHKFDQLPLTDAQKTTLKTKPKGNWQPAKWQYFGNIEEYADYNPISMIKTSVAPVAPSEVLGTGMEGAMYDMYESNIQMLSTHSAMKGAVSEHGPMSLGDGFNDFKGREFNIYLPYLKEQLRSTTKVKKENLLATQFVKLLFSDTQDNEKNWHSEKTEKLFKEYISILNNVRNIEEQRLLSQLNITKVDNGYVVNDKQSIKKVLIDELKRRTKNEEITERQIEFLQNLEDDINFDYTGFSQTLSEILAGYIKKRLVRIKLPGNALVLKSSYGVDETLKFYDYNEDGVSMAESKISMQGTFKALLKRPDVLAKAESIYGETPTKEQLRLSLNILIKDGKINQKAITIFGYRIPTSGINLMDAYVIKEFLPESAGNTIIIPKESVVKAGEDFDIDKKNFYFPSFDSEGNLIEKPDFIADVDATIEERQSKLEKVEAIIQDAFNQLDVLQDQFEFDIASFKELTNLNTSINLSKAALAKKFPELTKKELRIQIELDNTTKPKIRKELVAEINVLRNSDPDYLKAHSDIKELKDEKREFIKDVIDVVKVRFASNKKVQATLNATYKEAFKEHVKALDLYKKAKNYYDDNIKYETNQLIDVASQAITQPERYFSLVTPVSTDFLESQLSKTAKPFTPPNHRNTNFETILKKRMEMVLAGQKLTGFSATDSVAIQLFLKEDFTLASEYYTEAKNPVRVPIIFPFGNVPMKDGRYDLNSLYTQDGYLKSEIFNQLVQATIDAATASILAPVNITKDTLSIYQYLVAVIGLKLDDTTKFITNPAIVLRQKFLEQGYSSNESNVKVVEYYGGDITEMGFVDWRSLEAIGDLSNPLYNLYLYNEYRKQANEYLSIKQAINFDTKPDRTGLDAQARILLIRKLQSSAYFPKEMINNVLQDSAVSPKFITKLTKDIYSAYTPIRSNKWFISRVLQFETNYRSWDNAKKEKYRRLIQNDFQEWLIKNHLEIDGVPFTKYYKNISANIWSRVKKYPSIERNFNLNKIDDGIQHIHIIASAKDDGSIESIQKDLKLMKEQDPKLLKDFIVSAIGTHGFNVAPYTWLNMLPEQEVFDLIHSGVKKAEALLEKHPRYVTFKFMSAFRSQIDNEIFIGVANKTYENKPKYLLRSDLSQASINKYYNIPDTTVEAPTQQTSEVKEGVSEVFSETPELSEIGTEQQYSKYISSIFRDSKVKDIVYHGSHAKFDNFDKSLIGSKTRADIKGKGFFFSNSPNIAAGYKQSLESSNIVNDINFYYYFKKDLGNRDINKITEEEWQDIVLNYYDGETVDLPYIEEQSLEKTKLLFDKFKNDKQFDTVQSAYELDTSRYLLDNSTVYSTLINTKNPLVIEGNNRQMLSIVKKETEVLKDDNDGIIFNNVEDGLSGGVRFVANTYTVFEPEQIHILGSKADIKGFKDFKKNTTGTNYEAEAIFGAETKDIDTKTPKTLTNKQIAFNIIQQRRDNPAIKEDIIAETLFASKITPKSFDLWVDPNRKNERLNFIATKAKGGSELDVLAQSISTDNMVIDEDDMAMFILDYKSSTDYWTQQIQLQEEILNQQEPSITEVFKNKTIGLKSYIELPKANLPNSEIANYAKEKLGYTLAANILANGDFSKTDIDQLAEFINNNDEYTLFRFDDGSMYPLFDSSSKQVLDGDKKISIRKPTYFKGGIFEISGSKVEVIKLGNFETFNDIKDTLGLTKKEILNLSGIASKEDIRIDQFRRFVDGESQARMLFEYKLLDSKNDDTTSSQTKFLNSFQQDIC